MVIKKYLFSIFAVILAIGISSCTDDSTSVDESEAMIHGSVEADNNSAQKQAKATSNSTEGVMVTAARVNSSGSLETISEAEAETDASGEFALAVDMNAAEHIVLVAETETEELKGFLSAEVENGSSYTLKPINVESSAESEIYTELVADGSIEGIHKSDIEAVVRSEAASHIHTNSSAAADVAAGLSNYAEARAEFLAELGEDNVDAKLDQTFETMADIQFQYESDVASASEEEKEAAFETFLEARVDAYTEADFEANSVAKLAHMKTNVLLNTFSSVSSEAENDIESSTSLFAAIATDRAVRVSAEASGVSDATISEIADAGVTLKSELTTNGASADIEAAFETYHEEVRTALENDSSVEASVVVEIDSDINAAGGAKTVFDTALSGVISVSVLNDIYVTFINSTHSQVENNSEELGEVDAEAMAEILVLINLNS